MSGERNASATKPEIRVYPDPPSLAEAAAELFISLAAESAARGALFSVALSGGTTPRRLHARLAEPEMAAQVAWERVHIFWGDERCVPADHPESNYRMGRETLLDRVPIPGGNIHPIHCEAQLSQAAEAYQAELRGFFSPGDTPIFDLIILGLGEDGHTASLFPGSPGLQEGDRWVIPVEHRSPPAPLVDRVTLTPVLINAAAQVIFLVAGAGKASITARVLSGAYQPELLPAQIIQPTHGRLTWLLDAAAAAGLN